MKMIASTTVIRGNGACKVFMDGIMNEEVEKMKEQHEREIMALTNELAATKKTEKRLYAEKLPSVQEYTNKRYGLLSDIRDKIEVAWAFLWWLGTRGRLWYDDNNWEEEGERV